jgi:FkbM family methyltransferase
MGRNIGSVLLGYPGKGVSDFVRQAREYSHAYGLSWGASIGIALHWPLFRLEYMDAYGSRRQAAFARSILDRVRWYRFPHRIRRRYGGRFVVALPASREDFSSFREVLMGRAYASPWPLTDVASVLDLGANTGSALCYFAYATPATRMIAVEANPLLIPRLRRTASTLPVAVDVRHVAVASERKESISFVLDANHRHGRIGADGDAVVNVPCSSLTALLDSSGASPPDVLKMDIEGAEHALMAGEPEAFAAFRYVFAELHGSRQARERFSERLEGLGFEVSRDPGEEVDQLCARRLAIASA